MSESTDLDIVSGQTVVAAAGTRVPLLTGNPADTRVKAVEIRGLTSNTGLIFIGGPDVTSANGRQLAAGETKAYSLDYEEWIHGISICLSKIYIDAAVNGEGVSFDLVRGI